MELLYRRLKEILSVLLILLLVALSLAIPVPAKAAESAWTTLNSGSDQFLQSVWGTSGSDVYAVGLHGTILHYNGSTWSTMISGTSNGLYGVWGNSASDVFAVGGGGTILHYNGSAWSAMASGVTDYLYSVWGTSSTNVYAVGGGGSVRMILHYDGTTWSHSESLGTIFRAVWGSSASDVFAVGDHGLIKHYDGSTWSDQSYSEQDLYGIWGSSASNVFAVTSTDTDHLYYYNGSVWVDTLPVSFGQCSGVWGSSGNDVFAVGSGGVVEHYNGSAWSAMSSGVTANLSAVWGACASDVFAVGGTGTIIHYGDGCPPTITTVNPASGNQGECPMTVVITGTNFTRATAISFGTGITVSGFAVNSATQVTATVCIDSYAPPGAHNVSVTTPGGTATLTGCFNVVQQNQSIGPGSAVSHGSSIVAPAMPALPITNAVIVPRSASISAKRVTPGTPVTVTAEIANKSTVNGTKKVTLYVNGQAEATQGVTVSSGGSTQLTFSVSRSEPGDYNVYVDGVPAGSFKVEIFRESDGILIFSACLVGLAFILGMAMLWRRGQRTG